MLKVCWPVTKIVQVTPPQKEATNRELVKKVKNVGALEVLPQKAYNVKSEYGKTDFKGTKLS